MLSGRGLCNELITRPEESYRLWCVVVCDLETSRIGAPYINDISSLRVNGSLSSIHPSVHSFIHVLSENSTYVGLSVLMLENKNYCNVSHILLFIISSAA